MEQDYGKCTDDPISRTVQLLDLRNTRTYMHDSRRNVITAASARKASPRSVFIATSPRSPAPGSAGRSGLDFAGGSPGIYTATQVMSLATGQPEQAAAALTFFRGLEEERDAARATSRSLEDAMRSLTQLFTEHVAAVEATIGPASQFFTIMFGSGPIGMILSPNEAGQIEVAEMRSDPVTGAPLLARASGRIALGDFVIAVNGNYLHRYGVPTPEQVAFEFRTAERPMSVLFRRNGAARLQQGGSVDGSGAAEPAGAHPSSLP